MMLVELWHHFETSHSEFKEKKRIKFLSVDIMNFLKAKNYYSFSD